MNEVLETCRRRKDLKARNHEAPQWRPDLLSRHKEADWLSPGTQKPECNIVKGLLLQIFLTSDI